MNLQEQLIESGNLIKKYGEDYIEKAEKYGKMEEKFKILRAKVYNLERVQGLTNQVLREAEADIIMQGDERFKPLYEEYITAKSESKKAFYLYEIQKEINDNIRCLVNNLTFMKGN